MQKRRYVVVGLGFGDESKGATVDSLCYETGAKLVVRFNGGAQAAHNVVIPNGTHHTFAQFGSGTFLGAKSLLSQYMYVNPSRFMVEAETLQSLHVPVENLVFADARAYVTTPYHVWLNRVRELARGAARHGTTGMGIGETVIDSIARPETALRLMDLAKGKDWLIKRLGEVHDWLYPELCNLGGHMEFDRFDPERIADCYMDFAKLVKILDAEQVAALINAEDIVVFEGAQGVLLDQDCGFHPHTTWSHTTPHNALNVIMEAEQRDIGFDEVKIIGVTRTYTTRHGAGPFPTENTTVCFPERHNGDEGMAGQFRRGWLDLPLLKYAKRCCYTIHGLVVSHADCLPIYYCTSNPALDSAEPPRSMREQEGLTRLAWMPAPDSGFEVIPGDFPAAIAEALNVPLAALSLGPNRAHRHWFMQAFDN